MRGRVEIMTVELCFFFFQAEDGIRDVAVTGVQTCALPIYALELGLRVIEERPLGCERAPIGPALERGGPVGVLGRTRGGAGEVLREVAHRSEERRVGKEGRSRWSPYH